MTSRFQIPEIDDNPDGWGPSSTSIPDKFKDIPYYAPFNKGEKLGKAADWQAQYQGKARYGQKEGSGVSTIFNWYYQDDDSSFQLVDNTKTQAKKAYGAGRGGRYQRGGNFQQQQSNQGYRQQRGGQQGWQQTGGGRQQYPQQKKGQIKGFFVKPGPRWGQQDPNLRKREASIQVKEDWQLIEETEFNVLNKLIDTEPQPEDLMSCGSLEFYNKASDRITTNSDVVMDRTDRIFFNVTTSDDPIIRQLSMENRGTVFATDVILAHLMSCTRSVAPWDIIVTKVGSKLFFDKRDGSNFDYFTVNETAAEPPVEDARDPLNSASALMREATFINQNFSQQVLSKGEKYAFEQPNPFQSEGQEIAAVGYKYRKWNLGEGLTLVARCEIDGVATAKGRDLLLTIKALNEYDPKGEWRKRVDAQRGGVLATELKNNSNKLAKWTSQAMLAGTDTIKLGFVSRVSPKDFANHQLLAIQDYKPKEFAQQINLNTKNTWAILKKYVDLLMKQSTGKYILMKDPEKSSVKVYKVPVTAFEDKKDDDELLE